MPLFLVHEGKATPWSGGNKPTGKSSDWAIVSAGSAEAAIEQRAKDLHMRSGRSDGYKYPEAQESGPYIEVEDDWIESGDWPKSMNRLELVIEDIKSDTEVMRAGTNVESKRSPLSGNSAVVVAAQTLCDKLETWLENSNGDKWVRVRKEELADLFATADWLSTILAEK